MATKEYFQEYYKKNFKLYQYKSRMQRGSLKHFDFDECYDYYLYKNRPLKYPKRSVKNLNKLKKT